MDNFNRMLKENLEKEGLDYNLGSSLYTDIFRVVRDLIRSETNKHDLEKDMLVIRIKGLGEFRTKKSDNTRFREKYERKMQREREKLIQINDN